MNKDYLRKKYIKIRKNIKNKKYKSKKIFNKIIKSKYYQESKVIAIYCSLDSEVDTINLIKYMIKDNKKVYLPRVLDNSNMEFYKINNILDIKYKNNLGIYEPDINKNKLNKKLLDLIIIPGICFDKNKNRIGFGKGYYDSYLEGIKVFKIALSFDEQVLKDKIILTSSNDIKVDMIITDRNIYR